MAVWRLPGLVCANAPFATLWVQQGLLNLNVMFISVYDEYMVNSAMYAIDVSSSFTGDSEKAWCWSNRQYLPNLGNVLSTQPTFSAVDGIPFLSH